MPRQNGPSYPKKKAPPTKAKPPTDAKLPKKPKPQTDAELVSEGLKNPKRHSLNDWVKLNSAAKDDPAVMGICLDAERLAAQVRSPTGILQEAQFTAWVDDIERLEVSAP